MITKTAIVSTARDIHHSLQKAGLAWTLGVSQTLMPYRLAFLGPIWIFIQSALYTIAIAFFIGPSLGQQEPYFTLYVSIGMSLYLMFNGFISDGANVFTQHKSLILNIPNPFFLYPLILLTKTMIHLSISSLVWVFAMYWDGVPPSLTMLYAIPALFLCIIFGMGTMLFFGVVTARIRDVGFAAQSVMRLMLFVTPIFWLVTPLAGRRIMIAKFNPLFHLMELVRNPLMGRMPDTETWIIGTACAVGAFLLGLVVFARYRGRLAVWI